MNSAVLSGDQQAALAALADSPAARTALAKIEAQRTEQRGKVLADLAAAEAAAEKECAATAPIVDVRFSELCRARNAFGQAAIAHAEASTAAWNASAHLVRIRDSAAAALAELGGGALEAAIRAVKFELMAAPGKHTTGDFNALRLRLAELRTLIADLEALTLAPVAPADIERAAAEAIRWVEAAPVHDPGPRSKMLGMEFLDRLFKRNKPH